MNAHRAHPLLFDEQGRMVGWGSRGDLKDAA
jgi:hypothetical protein